ncbi:phosphotransferase family protein [Aquamicrobium sp. LC103]|uniref:phosphotransferase family protein n=1 Tax=Aquamicrobium sp. LC103 TaxID=1120658 RepID=UPI0009E4FAE5|nr:phosphotransferase family protein [Aquamicrobium sp. LC103]TKT75742.1 phosphotransferase family protein [Aquamicrobium sp. LC103]
MDAARFVGTEPLAANSPIVPERLQAWLAERLPDCGGHMTIERFRGGQSNPTMVLSFDGERRLVLRKKPDGKLLPSAHAVDREFRVISALRESDVPVAHARLLCDDDTVGGSMFYIMDYVAGRSFWEPGLPDMQASERAAIYDEMNRVIAALHSVDHVAVGLEDFGRPADYVARQVARWTKQYRASETETIEAMDGLTAWLPDNIPEQRRTSLIHGDYRIDNMIFHPSEPRVLALVDWELSTIGDPMADFAYHMLTWHFPGRPYRGLADIDLVGTGIPDERRYRDAYLRATGQEGVGEREWYAYLAYCLFRVAAIRQGIMKRVVDGTASSLHAREAGALARPVAELGWRYAEHAMRMGG